MAAGTELTPNEYITHHLTFIAEKRKALGLSA